MKREWRTNASIAELLSLATLACTAFLAAAPREARANSELDRQFALETVGSLRAWDNVDGLFAEYVNKAYREWFAKQSRFRIIDLAKADAILTSSKLPYYKVIDEVSVLGQVARSLRAESILRTKIYKEGPQYRVTIDWMHSPQMELMSSETITLAEPRDGQPIGGDITVTLHQAMDRLIAKVPFKAHVTGRDNNSVTVNIGENIGIKKGDRFTLATLDEVKKHPLLKAIVDWRMVTTGKVEVEEVDEGMAFCRILEEESGRRVGRYQKVVHISPSSEASPEISDDTDAIRRAEMASPPTLGYVGVGLWPGFYSRQVTGIGGLFNREGGGIFFGGKTEGELWLSRQFFLNLGFGYGAAPYSQKDVTTDTDSPDLGGGLSAFSFKLAAGYNFFASADFFGPRAWARLGYQSLSFSLPVSATEATGPSSHGGLFLGIGGDLPVRGPYGAMLTLDFGLLNSASFQQAGADGATLVSFFVGGYYRYTHRMSIRLGLDVAATGADFNTAGSSVTQKIFTLGPTLQYFF